MSIENTKIPVHVAIIMDGNGRWAMNRKLQRTAGHKEGIHSTRRVITECAKHGVQALTLFAFSSENWMRPKTEVAILMELFYHSLKKEVPQLAKNNIRLRVIGDKSAFASKLRRQIEWAEDQTANLTGMQLFIAANYGGQWDISQAVQQVAKKVAAQEISPEQINQELIEQHLCTVGTPNPDLFIRTGGECRISNFLLWQLSYTELYFTDTLWPDFSESDLELAFEHYNQRQRRFGMTAVQVSHA